MAIWYGASAYPGVLSQKPCTENGIIRPAILILGRRGGGIARHEHHEEAQAAAEARVQPVVALKGGAEGDEFLPRDRGEAVVDAQVAQEEEHLLDGPQTTVRTLESLIRQETT